LKKQIIFLVLFCVGLVMLSGCAGQNTVTDVPDPDGDLAGFWSGLWHGIIIYFSFIGSLFSDNISVYAVHNTGEWYDFGFLLGLGISVGSSVSSSTRSSS